MRRLTLLAALLLAPASARAQLLPSNVALLGARASGLGGAAAGLPSEDAAPFYNPACIDLEPYTSISFSAQALQLEQRSFQPYLGGRATESMAALVPNASVGSFPWRGGRASFAVFTTDDESLTLNQSFTPPASSGVSTARIRRIESAATYQVGPSYAHPIGDKLSAGFSMLYVYRTESRQSSEYAESTDQTANPAAISRTVDDDSVSQGLAFVGGVRFQPTGPTGRWTFGIALRSGVAFTQQSVDREQTFLGTYQNGALVFTLPPSQPLSSSGSVAIPGAAMGGASVRLGGGLLASQVTVTSAEANLAPGVAGKLTVDGALGGEVPIDNGWSARAGLFTKRSSVIDATLAPRIDQLGATLGVSKVDPHHVTDGALVLTRESGAAPVATVTGATAQASVSGYTLLVTVGGAFRF